MNREDVAMDLTVQNVEILRGRLEQAEALLNRCSDQLWVTGKQCDLGNEVEQFLASQQGEQATAEESAQVHPEQAEGAHVPDEVFQAEFQQWWKEEGQFCRAGGGSYERTFAFQAWRHLYPKLMHARAALAQPSTRKSHVAEALRAADWSNTCIGNKALIQAAIEHLEAQPSPAPELESQLLDVSAERNVMQRQRDAARGLLGRECDDADELIRLMGFDPEQYRTDGGSINLPKLRASVAQAGQVPENVRDELARRCLWLAFCWNDHNFEAAHICARKEAEKHGITSLDEANAWLAAAPAQGGEHECPRS